MCADKRPLPSRFPACAQGGAISLLAGLMLLLLILVLSLVTDSGRLYLEQQRLQKVADLAALEAMARAPDGVCTSASATMLAHAQESAARNGLPVAAGTHLELACVGITTVAGSRTTQPGVTGSAVEVSVWRDVPASLVLRAGALFNQQIPAQVRLGAQATARREEPTAAFTVGSQLSRLNEDLLLGRLLAAAGLDVSILTTLDSAGLATLAVSPSGLLAALGVEQTPDQLRVLSPQGLVDVMNDSVGRLTMAQLVEAVARALPADAAIQPWMDILAETVGDLHGVQLQLFGLEEGNALIHLDVDAEQTGSALEADIVLSDLLGTALMTGLYQQGRGLMLPDLNLLGAAHVELGIVEPPAIGLGPVGTQAFNPQVRLYVEIDTDDLLEGVQASLMSELGTRVRLPIWIDVITGTGTLTDIDCSLPEPTVDIAVESSILNFCVGEVPEALKWSTAASCDASLQPTELIQLLHQPLLSGKVHLPALQHSDMLAGLISGETRTTIPNALDDLDDTVEALVGALLDLLGGLFRAPGLSTSYQPLANLHQQDDLIARTAHEYLEASKDPGGWYNADAVVAAVLNGGASHDADGHREPPILADTDWPLPDSIPTTCGILGIGLTYCPQSQWNDGTFSEAFAAYRDPGTLLGVLGIPPMLPNGYQACGGLLTALLAWNACLEHNLDRFLREAPVALNLSDPGDGDALASTTNDTITCSAALCALLKPVTELLKPLLQGAGTLLNVTLNDTLGVEIGRTDVQVSAISCAVPGLVR